MRRLTPEPLHVAPELVGAPLASPWRRFAALVLDGVVIVVPTVAAGLGVAALILAFSDPAALRAVASLPFLPDDPGEERLAVMRDLAPLLVRIEAEGLPREAAEAIEAGRRDEAARLLASHDFELSLEIGEGAERRLPPHTIRVELARLIPPVARGIALLGVPALYFTLLTCGRRRATLGKRALGIAVVCLDGERLSWLEGLERFVGYVHIPATFFLSVVDLWRDPNRRLPHDRTVHTAVIRTGALKQSTESTKSTKSTA